MIIVLFMLGSVYYLDAISDVHPALRAKLVLYKHCRSLIVEIGFRRSVYVHYFVYTTVVDKALVKLSMFHYELGLKSNFYQKS